MRQLQELKDYKYVKKELTFVLRDKYNEFNSVYI